MESHDKGWEEKIREMIIDIDWEGSYIENGLNHYLFPFIRQLLADQRERDARVVEGLKIGEPETDAWVMAAAARIREGK